jgi:diguanylate cyclase (GGDEF)-like protein/PAS domain S-box-containing protein
VLHRQSETASASVAPAQVAELVKATREFAAADAGRALAAARWRADEHALAPQHLRLDADPVTGSEASAVLIGLPASGWSLVSLLPADRGLVGARQLVVYTLALAGTLGALMLLSFALFVRVALLAPLRRMVARLSTITAADKPGLHERPRNEIGALAYWINERLRQLREQADHAGAGQLQLSLEAKERRALIERLARFQERAAPALQTVRDAVIAVDDQGLVDDMNPAAQQMTGVSLTAARGRPLADIVDASSTTSDVTAASALTTAMQRGSRIDPREDFQLRCGTGAPREIRLSIIPQRSAGGRSSGAVLVLYERADGPRTAPPAAAAISLPRRAACEQRIGELAAASKAQKRRNAVLVVDLDRLSDINREAGRAACDEAIRKLGELLVEKSAGHGHAYHLHADRYALLLPGFDTARAKTFAEALRDGVARLRLGAAAQPTGMTVCVGIAEFGADAPPADMLPRAEDACAAAKRGGRNKVRTYDPSMERATRDVADDIWIKRVRTGIDQNRMHLTTQFVAAQRPGGGGAFFESLLALEDEEGFWSTATAFMPASERHGLAAAVDRWHIGSVAAQLTRGDTLQKVGLVSIRISQSSIFDAELPDFLIKLLEHHKTLSGRLCLELTESSLLAYPQQSGALAEVLRVIGIRMAVSDFLGREPSTLALIRHLPVEFLRVDAGRFPALATEASEQKLADSVLHLARLLERQTWVYGLDDAEQLERWRRLNPDLLQGAAIAAVSPVLFQQPR